VVVLNVVVVFLFVDRICDEYCVLVWKLVVVLVALFVDLISEA